MAVDMFLKLTDIKGESHDAKHKDEIDILAWSWGLSNSTSGVGSGHGAGKVNCQDLSFTKYVDNASSKLLLACCVGTHITEANLVVRKAGGEQHEYIKIKLTDILVSSVSTGGSGGEEKLTENISLAFAKVEFTYSPQDAKGAVKATTPFTYDFVQNKK